MHPLGQLLEQAVTDHLQSHIPINSWTKIDRLDAQGEQVLDCMWIYVYKFDKHGRARVLLYEVTNVCSNTGSTVIPYFYARFDLELKQYDAVNAFVHALLDSKVYMRMPPGYREHGNIYRLNKAVYGLRKHLFCGNECLHLLF
jgi:reverse transcriptase-like protein